ncbi:uncharacterized protein LOC131902000 [Peromyscus eremicus]|uniref:uncharacterized protein LOC131902000 n=1 Tax=Peromyscus eremicus TaxID=42410 RepID=UPI0027DB3A3D|nr:uncharacterized protein LOC131902000 [Peromyscus eremicus]
MAKNVREMYALLLFTAEETAMGQTVTTPLSLMLDHWSDVKARANNEGVVVKKNEWITLCKAEWVMMNRTHRHTWGIGDQGNRWPPQRHQNRRRPPEHPLQGQREDEAPAPSPIADEALAPSPIAGCLRGRRNEPAKESRAFPLREGPNHQLQYWPFSASDLYNWKQHNPPFSKDPVALTNLIESILVTHQPTWEDCQQLLQTFLTVEEKQRVFLEARKQVPGDDGRPTQLPNIIDAAFPLTRPNWDFTTPEGREHLHLYRQLLLVGLRGATRHPTNLAQVRNVIQGKDETPAAFLERLREAYRMYTPYDPEDPGQAPGVILSFIYQSSPDIRAKLQRLEELHLFSLSDLLKEAEKVFNKRETPEEREERMWQKQEERDRKRHREISKVLAAVISQGQGREGVRMGDQRRIPLDKDQCAYCKEKGHWARECPRKPQGSRRIKPRATDLLNLEN